MGIRTLIECDLCDNVILAGDAVTVISAGHLITIDEQGAAVEETRTVFWCAPCSGEAADSIGSMMVDAASKRAANSINDDDWMRFVFDCTGDCGLDCHVAADPQE